MDKNSEHVDSYYSPFYHLTSLCQLDTFSTTSRQARKLRRLDLGEDPDSSFNGMSLSLFIIIIYTNSKGRRPGVSTPILLFTKEISAKIRLPLLSRHVFPLFPMSLQHIQLLPKDLGEDQPPPPPEAWLYFHCQSLSLQPNNSTKGSRRRSDSPSSRGMSLPSLSMSLNNSNFYQRISAKIRLLLLLRHVFTTQCLSSSSIPTTQRQTSWSLDAHHPMKTYITMNRNSQ